MFTVREEVKWDGIVGILLVLVAALGVCGEAVAGDNYRVVALGTLGGDQSIALGINNANQVVGWADIAGPPGDRLWHAFLWDDGQMTDIGTLGGTTSKAYGINDAGVIVGEAEAGNGRIRPFLWRDGAMQDLGLGDSSGGAYGINDTGTVVGRVAGGQACIWPPSGGAFLIDARAAYGVNDATQVVGERWGTGAAECDGDGFLWNQGTITALVPLAGYDAVARAINAEGWVVGWSSAADGNLHPMLWVENQPIDLGTLGGNWGEAHDINNAGYVVGSAHTDAAEPRAFLWHDGEMVDLNSALAMDSGWVLWCATAINDHGAIAGYGAHAGHRRAFLLLPTGTVPGER